MDSGLDASHRPGMTEEQSASVPTFQRSARCAPACEGGGVRNRGERFRAIYLKGPARRGLRLQETKIHVRTTGPSLPVVVLEIDVPQTRDIIFFHLFWRGNHENELRFLFFVSR